MKKIISLIMVVAALCSFTTVSFAANEAPFSLTPAETTVALGDGTSDVDVTFAVTIDEEVTLSMFMAELVYDSANITIKSIDTSAMEAVMNKDAATDISIGSLTFLDSNAVEVYTVPAGTYNMPMVLTVNNTAEATYTITCSENTMIVAEDWATPINDLATYPTATITVAAGEKDDPTVVESTKDEAGENDLVTKGYLVSATVTEDTKAINGITITASSNDIDKEVPYTFTTVTNGTVKVAVNVLNVPSTATVDFSYALSTVAE